MRAYGAIPCEVTGECAAEGLAWGAVLTAMFMHGGWGHILGNMLFLWVFGNNIEDSMGHIRFLVFYLVCGLAASFAHIFFSPASQVPMVGASGAISGIMGAYILLYPSARVRTWFPPFFLFRIRAFFFLLLPVTGRGRDTAIIALTESGSTPLWMSRVRSDIPVFAFTRHESTLRRAVGADWYHATSSEVQDLTTARVALFQGAVGSRIWFMGEPRDQRRYVLNGLPVGRVFLLNLSFFRARATLSLFCFCLCLCLCLWGCYETLV